MTEAAQHADHLECPSCRRENLDSARFCAYCGARVHPEVGSLRAGEVADPLIGRTIADRYLIRSVLGRGGMGVVYRVEHVHIKKLMAMKLLHGELARDRETVRRFEIEAEAVSKLSHPNTVQVFDFGRSQGLMFLVMEYVEGHDLGWLIDNESPLSVERVARIAAQVCGSVAEAHRKGVVHRDLKPENVMLANQPPDLVKVLDFGLAKLREHEGAHRLTQAGSIVGTPYYMAPEHIRGETVDARSDVYALGSVLYKALTGVPPFRAQTPMGVLTKHLTDELTLPSAVRPDLPREVDALIARAMAREPADRFQHMADLRTELLRLVGLRGDESETSLRLSVDGSSAVQQIGGAVAEDVATRGDVDRYERVIRRRSRFGWFAIALLLCAVVAMIVVAGNRFAPKGSADHELEPNNDRETAHRLDLDQAVTAYLGRRMDRAQGDADFYAIEIPSAGEYEIAVSAIPNIDLLVEVVRDGTAQPLVALDGRPRGEAERAPNYVLREGLHFIRVRERWDAVEFPTENVSDPYTVTVRRAGGEGLGEQEPNDALEQASQVSIDAPATGVIGWPGDIDTFCAVAAATAPVTARVEGVGDLDLVLRVVNRQTAESRKYDRAGVGEPETSDPIEAWAPGQVCLEVTALSQGATRSSPDAPYSLIVEQVAP